MSSATYSQTPAVLAQLQENTRLQTCLAEHKVRSDRHKNNFELLKAQHNQLLENYRRLEESSAEVRRKHIESDQNARDAIVKLAQERDFANEMVDQLRVQAMTPQREDMIRDELTEQLTARHQQKIITLQNEIDTAKKETVRAQYDSQFAKTELQHEQREHQRAFAELVERHRLEIQQQSHQQVGVSKRLAKENTDFSQQFHSVQRENTQLRARVVSLENEMEERRAVEQMAESKLSETMENSEAVVSHVKAALKTSENELDGAEKQIQNLQSVIRSIRKEQEQTRSRSHELESQQMENARHLHDTQRQYKNEIADLQRQSQQTCSDLESKCTVLAAELRTWRCRAEERQISAEQATQRLRSKEDELSLRLQAVREEEWRRIAALEQEKLDVESRLSEEERLRRELSTQCSECKEASQQQLLNFDEEKKQLVEDAEKLRQHVSQLRERQVQLEKERNSLREVDKMHRDLQMQHRSLQGVEHELQTGNRQLQAAIDVLHQQLDAARAELREKETQHEQQQEEHRLTRQKQDGHMQSRLQELQKLNADLQASLQKITTKAKKIKHHGHCREQELQEQIELLEVKQTHAQQESQHLRNRMQSEVDNLQYKLKEMLRRHGEFNFILHAVGRPGSAVLPNVPAPLAPPLSGLVASAGASDSDAKDVSAKHTEHTRDLDTVHRRLAQLSTPKAKPAGGSVRFSGAAHAAGTSGASPVATAGNNTALRHSQRQQQQQQQRRQQDGMESDGSSLSSLNDFTDETQ